MVTFRKRNSILSMQSFSKYHIKTILKSESRDETSRMEEISIKNPLDLVMGGGRKKKEKKTKTREIKRARGKNFR